MTLNRIEIIERRKRIHVADLTNLMRIHSQTQNFGTTALLLLYILKNMRHVQYENI